MNFFYKFRDFFKKAKFKQKIQKNSAKFCKKFTLHFAKKFTPRRHCERFFCKKLRGNPQTHKARKKAPALAEGVWGRVFCVAKGKSTQKFRHCEILRSKIVAIYKKFKANP